MSFALFDYIESIKPSFGDDKRAKVGLMIMHYITLARVSGGNVRMEQALTSSGNPFVRKVLRNMTIVRDLAFALRVDMSLPYDETCAIPEGLRQLCRQYYIDVQLCIDRHQKAADVREELGSLIVFVRVARAVMGALHEDTLRALDETYVGHRPAGYKPKTKWLGFGTEHTTPSVRACDLPGARVPHPANPKSSPPSSGPVSMARKDSDSSSSSPSFEPKPAPRKRPAAHRHPLPYGHPTHTCEFVPSLAASNQAVLYAQRMAAAAYYQTLQQGMVGRRA
ncbi:unnamed protein product [Rhizoctonia solani]|uniref:Uncharacterized protein n=1 Tax=Rhizoctonia solani TaxID=456999 RepID=A0A8H3A4Y9_9AGAM|nr:unnamed protein product [Rhizoctonia solani]